MTEEIKEILYCDMYNDLDDKKYEKLLNYITNLQKENQSLKNNYNDNEQAIHKIMEENKRLRTELNGYKSKNKKVFELLQLLHYKFADGDSIHHDIEDIQKELRGGDE